MAIDHIPPSTTTNTTNDLLLIENSDYQAINPSLFVGLLSQLGDLIINSAGSHTPETRMAIATQAMALRNALAQATKQLECLPAGDLSLEDQALLIAQLEQRLELETMLLHFVSEAPNTLGLIDTPAPSITRQQTSSPTTHELIQSSS